ncbi:MAG: hypothetical protein ACPL7K_09200 [Armatimonadota bacterium]
MAAKIVTTCMIALVGLGFASSATAQFETSDTSPMGIGIAFYRPSDGKLRELNKTWIGPTLQFHVKRDQQGRPTAYVSIGWHSATKDWARANAFTVGSTLIKRYGGEETCWYVGGGLDVWFTHFEDYEFDPAVSYYRRVSDNDALFGYGIVFGREFGGGWYFEAKRDRLATMRRDVGPGVNFSGWTISFGSRLAY